jgi:hypothetical protein
MLLFQLKQVKTYEKSEKSVRAILTHSTSKQSETTFFGANSKSKIVVSVLYTHTLTKIKWHVSNLSVNFFFQPQSPLPIETS